MLVTLVLGACTRSADDPSEAGATGPTAREVGEARDRWEATGSDDYTFTLRQECFCPIGDYRISVVDGEAVAIEAVAGDAVEPGDMERLQLSIDDLLNLIEDSDEVASVRAQFDDEYGYPTRIDVDPEADTVDDEYTYLVSDYKPTS